MDYFFDAILNKYAVFKGRASRPAFWYYVLFANLSILAAVMLDHLAGLPLFTTGLALALFVPTFAVIVRRLHDADRSGWWALINAIPLGLLVLLAFFVTRGTEGANQYGPDPLGQAGG